MSSDSLCSALRPAEVEGEHFVEALVGGQRSIQGIQGIQGIHFVIEMDTLDKGITQVIGDRDVARHFHTAEVYSSFFRLTLK